jgi:hypothetical protein
MEVVKTYVAVNRGDNLRTAIKQTWARGGVPAFYQGLIPWVGTVVICSTNLADRFKGMDRVFDKRIYSFSGFE